MLSFARPCQSHMQPVHMNGEKSQTFCSSGLAGVFSRHTGGEAVPAGKAALVTAVALTWGTGSSCAHEAILQPPYMKGLRPRPSIMKLPVHSPTALGALPVGHTGKDDSGPDKGTGDEIRER